MTSYTFESSDPSLLALTASSLHQQGGKVLFSGHRRCEIVMGEETGTQKDVGCVIVVASLNGIAFPSGSVAVVLEQ